MAKRTAAKKMNPEQARQESLERIARHMLDLETLATTATGRDFKEQAVWCIKAALEHAYDAGRAAAEADAK